MSQIHHHEGWGPQPCSSIQTTHAVAWEPPDGSLSKVWNRLAGKLLEYDMTTHFGDVM